MGKLYEAKISYPHILFALSIFFPYNIFCHTCKEDYLSLLTIESVITLVTCASAAVTECYRPSYVAHMLIMAVDNGGQSGPLLYLK